MSVAIEENDLKDNDVPPQSSVLQSFPYVSPRVDQDNFQAEIPEYNGPC
jgi:hypothetical protein